MRRIFVLVVALLLVGCSSADDDGEATASGPGGSSPSSSLSPSPLAPEEDTLSVTIRERCAADVAGSVFPIEVAGGSRLAAIELGSGPHVAILLHEVTGGGLCGWVPYANWLADHGVRAVAIDQCGYADSECSEALTQDETAMVREVVRWTRAHGARRVTLVGASMGGSVALATGQRAGADAIVDLSGPRVWGGVASARTAARGVRVPLLVAASRDSDPAEFPALPRAVAASPAAVKRFISAPPGHGYELVTDLRTGAEQRTDVTATAVGCVVLRQIRPSGRCGPGAE